MQNNEIINKIKNLIVDQEKPLTFDEACLYLNCSKSWLYKQTHLKQISFYKPNSKKIYFKKTELNNWLLRNRSAGETELDEIANSYVIGSEL